MVANPLATLTLHFPVFSEWPLINIEEQLDFDSAALKAAESLFI
jgi:hypothetical protein